MKYFMGNLTLSSFLLPIGNNNNIYTFFEISQKFRFKLEYEYIYIYKLGIYSIIIILLPYSVLATRSLD